MHAERQAVAVTTAADGSATYYTGNVNGRVDTIRYAKTDFADTADFAITAETTGVNLWTEANITASETMRPVAAPQLTDGSDSTITEVPILLDNERIKIVIAQGGNAKSGTFHITVEGNIQGDTAAS